MGRSVFVYSDLTDDIKRSVRLCPLLFLAITIGQTCFCLVLIEARSAAVSAVVYLAAHSGLVSWHSFMDKASFMSLFFHSSMYAA